MPCPDSRGGACPDTGRWNTGSREGPYWCPVRYRRKEYWWHWAGDALSDIPTPEERLVAMMVAMMGL